MDGLVVVCALIVLVERFARINSPGRFAEQVGRSLAVRASALRQRRVWIDQRPTPIAHLAETIKVGVPFIKKIESEGAVIHSLWIMWISDAA